MSGIAAEPEGASGPDRTFIARLRDSDLLASFLSSKVTVAAGAVTIVLFLAALLAPWIAPTDPFNPATNYLSDSLDPPSFIAGGDPRFLLGTDDQGRDMLSAILYGLRVSLVIGVCGVALGAAIGVGLGLISGYAGGWIDSIIMRIADVQLTFPAILIALLLDGVAHAMLKAESRDTSAVVVLVVSIGLSFWVQYAIQKQGDENRRKRQLHVGDPHEDRVRPASGVSRDQPEPDAERGAEGDAANADRERDA